MKTIAVDELTLAFRDFLQHKPCTANDVCKLMADIFGLHLACIFSETRDGNTINFSRVGFYSKNKVKIPDQIPFVELPNKCQELWNSSVQKTAGIHSLEDRGSIKKFSDRIGAIGIKQFGFLKFYWSSDKNHHLLIAGVITECKHSDVETFFTKHNLESIQGLVQVLTCYVDRIDSEFRECLENIR